MRLSARVAAPGCAKTTSTAAASGAHTVKCAPPFEGTAPNVGAHVAVRSDEPITARRRARIVPRRGSTERERVQFETNTPRVRALPRWRERLAADRTHRAKSAA